MNTEKFVAVMGVIALIVFMGIAKLAVMDVKEFDNWRIRRWFRDEKDATQYDV